MGGPKHDCVRWREEALSCSECAPIAEAGYATDHAESLPPEIADGQFNWRILFDVSGGWRAQYRDPERLYGMEPDGEGWGHTLAEAVNAAVCSSRAARKVVP